MELFGGRVSFKNKPAKPYNYYFKRFSVIFQSSQNFSSSSPNTSQPWWFRLVILMKSDLWLQTSWKKSQQQLKETNHLFWVIWRHVSNLSPKNCSFVFAKLFFLFEEEPWIRHLFCKKSSFVSCVIFGFDFLKFFFFYKKTHIPSLFLPSQQNVVWLFFVWPTSKPTY